jgi:hypothetical protein
MTELQELADRSGLSVIEDAAQALGATYRGRRCGSLGDIGCFSFYYTKNLGALGEAGCAISSDEALARELQLLRHHGHNGKYMHQRIGHNLRLDEIQAAVLRIRLTHLEATLARRREIAQIYQTLLQDSVLGLLAPEPDCEPAWHLFPVRCSERDALREYLFDHGIETGIHYPVPAHKQPALQTVNYRAGDLATTESAVRELVSLPFYPEMTDEQVEEVTRHCLEFLAGMRARIYVDGNDRDTSVHLFDPGDESADRELHQFFDTCATSFAQQTPHWRSVIECMGVDEPLFLGARNGGGRLVGVLPVYRFEGPFGAILNSAPQAGPLGGIACRPESGHGRAGIYSALLEAFSELAVERDCALASVISNPLWPDQDIYEHCLRPDYTLRNSCCVTDLHAEDSPVAPGWEGPTNLQRNLRKALSGSLVIDEEQSPENLQQWYVLHRARHLQIGATPLPQKLFEATLVHMVPADKARFFFVRLAGSGEMVAGGLYLYHEAVMDSLMPSFSSTHARLAPNYLLALHSMRWARDRGIRYYNWQASPPDGGVHRFKRQWSGVDRHYAYFTRITGDASAFLASNPAEVSRHYPWHYALPFDRLGGRGNTGLRSSRADAWHAREDAGT